MRQLKKNEYQCAMCRKIYTKGWSDEEARRECEAVWGSQPEDIPGGFNQVCDDCWKEMNPKNPENERIYKDTLNQLYPFRKQL